MCWCVGGQTANMAEKEVTASGYGTGDKRFGFINIDDLERP